MSTQPFSLNTHNNQTGMKYEGGRLLLHHTLGKWGLEWPFDDMHK